VKTGKGRSGSSSVTFCNYLEVGEKVRAFEDRKWHKDNKYWSLPGTDKNTSVASPLQASLPDIVIRRELVSRRYSYKTVRCCIYKEAGDK